MSVAVQTSGIISLTHHYSTSKHGLNVLPPEEKNLLNLSGSCNASWLSIIRSNIVAIQLEKRRVVEKSFSFMIFLVIDNL